jgi:DNA-binding response OmpR family regulator
MTLHVQRLRVPARMLLVIDQLTLIDAVKLALRQDQYSTTVARTAEQAATTLTVWQPHLVVIDMDSMDNRILERLADVPQGVGRLPAVALTRRRDLKARLEAFEQGADDILVVPFSPEEFGARVLAIMRRAYRDAPTFAPVLRLGELEIDIQNRHVRAGGTELHLTTLEQSLLYLLAANAGRLLTRDEIMDHLWGADYVAGSNVVDRHIHNLRLKLQNHSKRLRYIATVPGRGYRFLLRTADEPNAG